MFFMKKITKIKRKGFKRRGQKCPLSREEQRGTKLSPKQGRNRGGQNCPLDREEPKGGQNCPLSREETEGDKIVP